MTTTNVFGKTANILANSKDTGTSGQVSKVRFVADVTSNKDPHLYVDNVAITA